ASTNSCPGTSRSRQAAPRRGSPRRLRFVGHRQVAATARRHGVSRSLLTVWRRQYRDGELGGETAPAFIPLTLSPGTPAPATAPVVQSGASDVRLEIVLRNGRRLLVPSTVDLEILARLLPVLDSR
ncbi:IS66-like element accessory protein TnpA, partial [Thalassovita aquimarina]|uniref:IS66-like element accessory protein TnpA n=1 Tax=Thalassovita aquimarina TaxID=2785917 RepID=UPI001C5527D4